MLLTFQGYGLKKRGFSTSLFNPICNPSIFVLNLIPKFPIFSTAILHLLQLIRETLQF